MPPFSEFEKMSKSLKNLSLDEKQMKNIDKSKWVVTEKAHGANFSFIYKNKTLYYAKRKEYLTWQDDFFGFQTLVHQIEDKILSFFETLRQDFTAEKYILYGELIGGEYPHAEIKAIQELQAIQTGVYYTPSIQFYAFDIALENQSIKQYLDYEIALKYFEKFQILHAKPLFIGRFTDCLSFDTRINSTIPQQLNLPLLSNNLIEGVVIKLYQNPQNIPYEPRIILKMKNAEFDEEKKFHESEKWSYIPNLSTKTENLGFILAEMQNYVTQNRLNSVLSKIGRLTEERLPEIKTAFREDVWTDFQENNENILNDLEATEQKWLQDRIDAEILLLITNSTQ